MSKYKKAPNFHCHCRVPIKLIARDEYGEYYICKLCGGMIYATS